MFMAMSFSAMRLGPTAEGHDIEEFQVFQTTEYVKAKLYVIHLETPSISLEITDTNKPQLILQHRRCA